MPPLPNPTHPSHPVGHPSDLGGAADCRAVVDCNADEGVTCPQSYVSANDKATFCVYEAPSPEAIRRAAARNGLPVDRITQVRVLDPHFDG